MIWNKTNYNFSAKIPFKKFTFLSLTMDIYDK